MSLELIDFTERKKKYKLEAGEFTLRPPYMNLIGQVEILINKVDESRGELSTKGNDTDSDTKKILKVTESKGFKKIMDTYLKLLKLLLEETGEGKLSDLTVDNLRLDVAEAIVKDFICQFKRRTKK
jgi:hypothetical protein